MSQKLPLFPTAYPKTTFFFFQISHFNQKPEELLESLPETCEQEVASHDA